MHKSRVERYKFLQNDIKKKKTFFIAKQTWQNSEALIFFKAKKNLNKQKYNKNIGQQQNI